MSQEPNYDWNESKTINDVDFEEADVKIFQSLLDQKEKSAGEGSIASMESGQILKGIIVELTPDSAIVDVGLKSEGMIPIKEFEQEELCLETEIEVYLERAEGEDGQIVLSREKARKQRQWEYIVSNCKEGSIVQGTVVRQVKGGLTVDIGIDAFLPSSQIDIKRIKDTDLNEYLGKKFEFKILKINLERKNIVVSRKAILEEERSSKKAALLKTIKEGEKRKGVVKNITDFGVFLDLDGIDGLLHITDMTWKRMKHPSEMVRLNDILEVKILHVDTEKERVALGLKQNEPNPWEDIERRYPPGTRIRGKIGNLFPYGAFVEIEPGIEGLLHVSEMSWTKNVTNPSEIVSKGDEVDVIVLSIDKEIGKVSLSLKQTEKNPWEGADERYPVGTKVKTEVQNLTNFGAFVELEPGLPGLIHISDFSWTKKISHPSEILKRHDIVEAEVLSVDIESKKITLGIKQLTHNPWEEIEKKMPVDSIVKGIVNKITAFGAFVELENGIEGLVHVTELSDQPFGKVEEIVSVGDEVTAKIIKVDPEHKKISLSIKDHLIEQNREDRDDIVVDTKKKKNKDRDHESLSRNRRSNNNEHLR